MTFSWTTFGFEVANFLLLLWLLQRFVLGPLKAGIDARRRSVEATTKDAEQKLEEAERIREDVQGARRAIEDERLRVLAVAEEDAAKARARLLESAHADAKSEQHRAARALDLERAELVREAREQAVRVSVELAGVVLQNTAPAALHDALTTQLTQALDDGAERLRLTKARRATLTLPSPAYDSMAAAVRERVHQAMGSDIAFDVEHDAALVAGARLRVGDTVVDATLPAQLSLLESIALERIGADGHG